MSCAVAENRLRIFLLLVIMPGTMTSCRPARHSNVEGQQKSGLTGEVKPQVLQGKR
jgi:hypothetical protein